LALPDNLLIGEQGVLRDLSKNVPVSQTTTQPQALLQQVSSSDAVILSHQSEIFVLWMAMGYQLFFVQTKVYQVLISRSISNVTLPDYILMFMYSCVRRND
jgi:hypothetical protein